MSQRGQTRRGTSNTHPLGQGVGEVWLPSVYGTTPVFGFPKRQRNRGTSVELGKRVSTKHEGQGIGGMSGKGYELKTFQGNRSEQTNEGEFDEECPWCRLVTEMVKNERDRREGRI